MKRLIFVLIIFICGCKVYVQCDCNKPNQYVWDSYYPDIDMRVDPGYGWSIGDSLIINPLSR